MKTIRRFIAEEQGGLAFEWTLLWSVIVIGIVGGVAAVRDAVIDELGDVAQAMLALDHSYSIGPPLSVSVHAGQGASASDSSFTDAAAYNDCPRSGPTGAPAQGKSKSKANNGVGDGSSPPPPGNPPENDGPGTGPGNPGNKGKGKS